MLFYLCVSVWVCGRDLGIMGLLINFGAELIRDGISRVVNGL